MIPNVLSIAGSDPSGGAGVQADLKTFAALGCYGMSVITALTAQNTQSVSGVFEIPDDFVRQQIQALAQDVRVDALKIGMIGSAETIKIVAEMIESFAIQNIVLDPVIVATSGDRLISDKAAQTLRHQLIPLADIITPNVPEGEYLLRKSLQDDFKGNLVDMASAITRETKAKAVLLKGGHLDGESSMDVLCDNENNTIEFSAPREYIKNTHGTGCTLSSAIAAGLAKGLSMQTAIQDAKDYITQALVTSDSLDVGQGRGPVHHFHSFY